MGRAPAPPATLGPAARSRQAAGERPEGARAGAIACGIRTVLVKLK